MPPAGFEPTIPVSERPQINAFDGAATGIGTYIYIYLFLYLFIYYVMSLLSLWMTLHYPTTGVEGRTRL